MWRGEMERPREAGREGEGRGGVQTAEGGRWISPFPVTRRLPSPALPPSLSPSALLFNLKFSPSSISFFSSFSIFVSLFDNFPKT